MKISNCLLPSFYGYDSFFPCLVVYDQKKGWEPLFYRIYGKANTEQDNLANDVFPAKIKKIIIFLYVPSADCNQELKLHLKKITVTVKLNLL